MVVIIHWWTIGFLNYKGLFKGRDVYKQLSQTKGVSENKRFTL